jgi:transposase-like protein
MMDTIQKIRVAQDVLDRGKKIATVAKTHGISQTTVRRYMDMFCDKKFEIDLHRELENLRIHTFLAKKDDAETKQRRLEYIDETVKALLSQVEKV